MNENSIYAYSSRINMIYSWFLFNLATKAHFVL